MDNSNNQNPSATPPTDTWPPQPSASADSNLNPVAPISNDAIPPAWPAPADDLNSPWAPSVPATPTPPVSEPAPATAVPSGTWPSLSQTPAPSEPATPDPMTPVQPEPTPAEPTPTFTPPTLSSVSDTTPTSSPTDSPPQSQSTSPLDNPWGTSSQTPTTEPQPATQPSWTNTITPPTDNQPPAPPDAAPTDLSHLITNNNAQSEPVQPTSETLGATSAPTPNPAMPNLPVETHKGIPRWLIGLGGGLLILVLGASAYFILGIGQPTKTTSLPATTAPESKALKPPVPIATPGAQPSEQPAADSSANFGEVGGNTQPQEGTGSSTIETLRRRSQQGI